MQINICMILRKIGGVSDVMLDALHSQFQDKFLYNFNSIRHSTDWSEKTYRESILQNKHVLCVETPLIGRKLFNENSHNSYFRIGLNIVSTFFERNFFIPPDPGSSRLQEILTNTNTTLQPWRKNGEHIVYAMQVPYDSSLLGLDVFAAAQYDLIMLRKLTNRPIFVSLHPDIASGWGKGEFEKNKMHYDAFLRTVDFTRSNIATVPTSNLFNDAWCTVCHTSGTAFDSIAAGIPVITLHERSFLREISSSSHYDIESPKMIDIIPWLSKIAYCQWTIEEVNSGLFKSHVEKFI